MSDILSPEEALLRWYEKLPGRTVDLIGDYAGNELFLVEGDSLLLHCLDTDEIDFHEGFQLLHAVHSVEVFLAALLQRKANFHIAFFDQHAKYSIPARAAPEDHFKYQLAREVVIRHLTVNLPLAHPSVRVTRYTSYQDSQFVHYVDTSGLYFALVHDGASATIKLPSLPDTESNITEEAAPSDEESNSEDDSSKALEEERHLAFRMMMFWLVQRGRMVALINSVEYHDTKIMAMVQEASRRLKAEESIAAELFNESNATSDASSKEQASQNKPDEVQKIVEKLPPSLQSSESLHLVAVALKRMLANEDSYQQQAAGLVVSSVLTKHLDLSQRRFRGSEHNAEQEDIRHFLSVVAAEMIGLLRSMQPVDPAKEDGPSSDVADLIDGRMLEQVLSLPEVLDGSTLDKAMQSEVNDVMAAIGLKPLAQKSSSADSSGMNGSAVAPRRADDFLLLPFSNETFDKHLSAIKVDVDSKTSAGQPSVDTARTFRELTHWHNTKPVNTGPKVQLTDWQKSRALRSNQFFVRELQQYAASLTSSTGKSLDPERIFVGQAPQSQAPSSAKADAQKAENTMRLAEKNDKKFISAWQTQLKDLEAVKDVRTRYLRTHAYLRKMPADRKSLLGSEVELYGLSLLLQLWSGICQDGKQEEKDGVRFSALIFDTLNKLHHLDPSRVTVPIQKALRLANDSLGLPFKVEANSKVDRPLSFNFAVSQVDNKLKVPSSALDFELRNCGPYLDRSIDSASDERVKFDPDRWQRHVLDLIDARKSMLVVAPTSAGKTFISFYAMKQILRDSDDGILVYVAPTKALVNQIAAELQAQFSKNYKYPGKSVWAIHTRDYRINDPTQCQVLVTVPHVLQIMLLAPSNAKSWSQRVKRIIFDEIHCIGQAEDGVVWEQLLLLSPCPITALSATVGNPDEFTDWLRDTQRSMGNTLEMVQHPYRYSDLRKFVYHPPKSFRFQPLRVEDTLGLPSLDGAENLAFMHPVAALVNESRGIPGDLHLEPRDCLSLYKCMKKHATAQYPLSAELSPEAVLPPIVRKVDVLKWEAMLKDTLKQWMSDSTSPFRDVMEELSKPLHSQEHGTQLEANGNATAKGPDSVDEGDLLSTTLPLLTTLNARNALPAILFNYDRSMCDRLGRMLLEKLMEHEEEYKKSSPVWKKKIAAFEDYKKAEAKKRKAPPKKSKKGADDDEGGSKAEREREAADIEANPFAAFDPDAPVLGFHFADETALLPSEFEAVKKRLEYRHIAPWLIDTLRRGIGIHHAGMNRAYRQAVETLFRRRYLRVVVATGTLALGINMPCKTVVFSGDSVFLTALNYRQASGRAGRRGFDLLGNVIFQNIRLDKVQRLVSSRLPDLNGHFPITTTLVLRLFTLLHDSKGSPYAKKAIDSLLSQPRMYLGGEEFRDQVLHHLRYSIEYLRRQHLLSMDGRPLNFAGTVSHLYFTENSAFAFHVLLKDGYFNRLCADFVLGGKSEPRILDTLMLTMAHLFGRQRCRRADAEFVESVVKKYSSCVFLPKMPRHAEQLLRAHNSETLQVFATYVRTFVEQHQDKLGPDSTLPFTQQAVGGKGTSPELASALHSLAPTTIRSAFVALSGHGDDFASIGELCRNVRDGVFLESSAIPHVAIYPQEEEMPLNAYLYDFYKHGDVATIEKANGVKRGDIWFLLNDFSLVLATIVTSFKNYMNMPEDADLEFVEVAGSGDVHELDEDERIATEADTALGGAAQKTMPVDQSKVQATQDVKAPSTAQQKKKKKVAESWEEDEEAASSSEASDWDAADSDTEGKSISGSTEPTSVTTSAPAWEENSGEGLRKVALAFQRLKTTFDERFKAMWA